MSSVLAGRRVVVTRAAEQADDLATLLEQVGAVPVVIPLIEIVSDQAGVAQLAAESEKFFDWLIVTSPNGAAAVVKGRRSPATHVAAIGRSTADVLRMGGFDVSFVPVIQSAAGLLAELPALLQESLGAVNVLVVQAANAEPALADGLRAILATGSAVTVVTPFRSVAARVTASQQLAALSADAVFFASGTAARAWADVFGDAAPPIVVAIGPQTAASATQAGLKVSVVAADHSLSGMVMALERHLSSTR